MSPFIDLQIGKTGHRGLTMPFSIDPGANISDGTRPLPSLPWAPVFEVLEWGRSRRRCEGVRAFAPSLSQCGVLRALPGPGGAPRRGPDMGDGS
eukprot:gene14483-biopygen8732